MENKRENEEDEIAEQGRISEPNWSERVEDLVAAGNVTAAISFLEFLVTNRQSWFGTSSSSSGDNHGGERTEFGLQLAAALTQLADLYSSQGISLKSDELLTRSSLIKQHALDFDLACSRGSGDANNQAASKICDSNGLNSDPNVEGKAENSTKASSNHDSSDDDWEALADREPSTLLSVEDLPEISKLSVEEPELQEPKRRGRGNFTYEKDKIFSDRDFCKSKCEDSEDNDMSRGSEKTDDSLKSLEACKSVQCSFTIRVLDDHDSLLGSISGKDLEPPSQRPKTSARTAQRLIAHSMGLKLPASGFGSKELRDQEAARKNRIASRQKQQDDAWGDD